MIRCRLPDHKWSCGGLYGITSGRHGSITLAGFFLFCILDKVHYEATAKTSHDQYRKRLSYKEQMTHSNAGSLIL